MTYKPKSESSHIAIKDRPRDPAAMQKWEEEVQKVYPELVSIEDDGQAGGIKYTKLTAILVKTIQDLTARIEKLENNKK